MPVHSSYLVISCATISFKSPSGEMTKVIWLSVTDKRFLQQFWRGEFQIKWICNQKVWAGRFFILILRLLKLTLDYSPSQNGNKTFTSGTPIHNIFVNMLNSFPPKLITVIIFLMDPNNAGWIHNDRNWRKVQTVTREKKKECPYVSTEKKEGNLIYYRFYAIKVYISKVGVSSHEKLILLHCLQFPLSK